MESDSPKFADAKRLEKELHDVKAHLAALTAVVGGITTAGAVNFERLEECVNFAVKGVRPGVRPVVLTKAAAVLEDLEGMQKALEIEARKSRGLKVARSRTPRSAPRLNASSPKTMTSREEDSPAGHQR